LKNALAVVGGVLALVALVIGVWALAFGISWFTAGPKGKLEARQQILSGQYRIAAYDHFFDLCVSVQNAEASLDAQNAELVDATGDDRERIKANIAALTAVRLGGINQYNADALKDKQIGQFRASGLPQQLPVIPYKRGTQTSCTV
jgi:hypothetical protein